MAAESLFSKQNAALRQPSEIFGTSFETAGITKNTLKYSASASFTKLLHDLRITLIASREYEHLLIALYATSDKKLSQTFIHLPHPSGIAIDRDNNVMYVAATRNPNQIIEFRVSASDLDRVKFHQTEHNKTLLPVRAKYYPGEYYFHDLAVYNGKLYANSVGMNCVIEVDMNSSVHEQPLWWPSCIDINNVPDTRANYIQLNSIAFGSDLNNSFFSASGAKISSRRPGHANYPVDGQGVIFSGKTRMPIGFGLTRPHSARIYKDKVWVANSGYGEIGYIEEGEFKPVFKFNGWTRGLHFIDNILFIGISRVLPRFRQYAPGIKSQKQICSIVAIDVEKGKMIGDIKFPYGNQLFAIDHISSDVCNKLPFHSLRRTAKEKKVFSVSTV